MIVEENRTHHVRLSELRHFTGPSRELWPPLAEALAALVEADRCLLALGSAVPPSPPSPSGNGATPQSGRQWGRLHDWTRKSLDASANALLNGALVALAESAAADRTALRPLSVTGAYAIALRLPILSQSETCVAILLLVRRTEATAREALDRLLLVEDTVRLAQEYRQAREEAVAQRSLTETVELLAVVQDQTRFYAAAIALCNGLADRTRAERVSLGWLRGPAIRLRAVSRTERINRQMELAQALESVMEEAVDQDADLAYEDHRRDEFHESSPPVPISDSVASSPLPFSLRNGSHHDGWITREHAEFARNQSSPNLLTLVVRAGTEIVGAITLERSHQPWEPLEQQQTRVILDLVGRRLCDQERLDRWFGARCAAWFKEKAAWLLGPRHTWAKLLGLGIFTLLLVLIFVRLPYRVESNFNLRAEQLAQIGVPFDGYIGLAYARPGDLATNGQPLLQLDIRDLVLEEAAAQAEIQRYQREIEKARATASLGEMRIAEALVHQSSARLAQLRHRLQQSSLRSPFDGVVIEGDFHERLGQPVRQGDPLFRIARLDRVYIEAEVPERDVHELTGAETGEVAFLTQPAFKFAIRGRTLEPAAVAREGGNVFLYRCELQDPPAAWFRPGMQGVAKLDAGRRRPIWILTHRTIDFLRLHLWW